MDEADEKDDDREQDVLKPADPPNEPRIPVPVPVVGDKLGSHKDDHMGNQNRRKLYHGPPKARPWEIPPEGIPEVIPEEVQEAIGEPIPEPAPAPPKEVGVPAKPIPVRKPAKQPLRPAAKVPQGSATSGEEGRTPWEQYQAQTVQSYQSSSSQSTEAQGSRITELMLGGAGIAAAASTIGQGGQLGPPSAPAELQSSTAISEMLLAKRLAELRRRSSRSTSPVPAEVPGEWDIPKLPEGAGAGATGGGEGQGRAKEAVAAIALAVATADAVGRGANAITRKRNKSRDLDTGKAKGASPGQGGGARGRGGFTGPSVADKLLGGGRRLAHPQKEPKEPKFIKNYGRDDDSETFDRSQE